MQTTVLIWRTIIKPQSRYGSYHVLAQQHPQHHTERALPTTYLPLQYKPIANPLCFRYKVHLIICLCTTSKPTPSLIHNRSNIRVTITTSIYIHTWMCQACDVLMTVRFSFHRTHIYSMMINSRLIYLLTKNSVPISKCTNAVPNKIRFNGVCQIIYVIVRYYQTQHFHPISLSSVCTTS